VRMYDISKQVVWEAYKKIKANKGAAGVDNETMAMFEENVKDNLYVIWNRMSSGSYFPPPVKVVEIPKSDGKKRKLGIPTVSDRIAQMVVKIYLEPQLDSLFHEDSYGYRPNKSAHQAIGKTRERCWQYAYVIDLDIKGFFDEIDHELLMRAVKKHAKSKWQWLYIERWIKAPAKEAGSPLQERTKGTPQGGVISPVLANLFLHYAFDEWMKRNYPSNPFARYADDVIVHCKTQEEAESLRKSIEERMKECKLQLHPDKTRIVQCKQGGRKDNFPEIKFDFLGYEFRPRRSKTKGGENFTGFLPAVSDRSMKAIRQTVKEWKLPLCSGLTLEAIAKKINPIVQGWINYYGKFYKSRLYFLVRLLDGKLVKWAKRKYKRLRLNYKRAREWLSRIANKQPTLMVHWQLGKHCKSGQ
jgi:RNA-directed DNA polymerase